MREIEQLRRILDIREQEYSAALEAKDFQLADRVLQQRDNTFFDLMDLVHEEKQFAWHNEPDWSSAWYDTSAELQ